MHGQYQQINVFNIVLFAYFDFNYKLVLTFQSYYVTIKSVK